MDLGTVAGRCAEMMDEAAVLLREYGHDGAAASLSLEAGRLAQAVGEHDRYNGWANRETWALHLHLTNTEWLYDLALEYAAQDGYGDALKDWVEALFEAVFLGNDDVETAYPMHDVALMASDVGSLWRVDWREVHAALTED